LTRAYQYPPLCDRRVGACAGVGGTERRYHRSLALRQLGQPD